MFASSVFSTGSCTAPVEVLGPLRLHKRTTAQMCHLTRMGQGCQAARRCWSLIQENGLCGAVGWTLDPSKTVGTGLLYQAPAPEYLRTLLLLLRQVFVHFPCRSHCAYASGYHLPCLTLFASASVYNLLTLLRGSLTLSISSPALIKQTNTHWMSALRSSCCAEHQIMSVTIGQPADSYL